MLHILRLFLCFPFFSSLPLFISLILFFSFSLVLYLFVSVCEREGEREFHGITDSFVHLFFLIGRTKVSWPNFRSCPLERKSAKARYRRLVYYHFTYFDKTVVF